MFEFKRTHNLPQFRAEIAVLARLQQPRDLHADRGRTGNDVAICRELPCSAAERERINPEMRWEAFIFIGKEQLEKPRVDVLACCR